MFRLVLISVFSVLLFGCESDFDKCFAAETGKLSNSYHNGHPELATEVLPILLTDTEDNIPLWEEFYAAVQKFQTKYFEEHGFEDFLEDQAPFNAALQEAEIGFPHAEKLVEIRLANAKASNLMITEGVFDSYDPDILEKFVAFQESAVELDQWYGFTEFFVPAIRSLIPATAREVCNTRGLYE